jgi:DNA-binding transcriptional LysR family regulator
MQNRRIVDAHLREVGAVPRPSVETNSVITLCSHLRSGEWSSVLPQTFLGLFGEPFGSRAIPLVEPEVSHSIGLVIPDREPLTPSARHLAQLVARPDVIAAVALMTAPEGAAPPGRK